MSSRLVRTLWQKSRANWTRAYVLPVSKNPYGIVKPSLGQLDSGMSARLVRTHGTFEAGAKSTRWFDRPVRISHAFYST